MGTNHSFLLQSWRKVWWKRNKGQNKGKSLGMWVLGDYRQG